jgi:hypothetical protein
LGHSGKQAPQEMHSSVINRAMTLASLQAVLTTSIVAAHSPAIKRGLILDCDFLLSQYATSREEALCH